MVVAFSGGADSSFLAKVAHDTLGRDAVLCATALSPSLAGAEEADCRALADEWGLRWVGVPTDEMDDAGLRGQRPGPLCPLQDRPHGRRSGPLAAAEGATVVLGVNVSDLGDHRPGQAAAAAAGAVFPLVEAGFDQGRHPALVPRARACAPGTSRPRPAWPRACPTARRSPSGAWRPSRRPSRRCARSASASCGCATTATPPASRSRPAALAEVRGPPGRGRRGGARGRVHASSRWTWKASAPAA